MLQRQQIGSAHLKGVEDAIGDGISGAGDNLGWGPRKALGDLRPSLVERRLHGGKLRWISYPDKSLVYGHGGILTADAQIT